MNRIARPVFGLIFLAVAAAAGCAQKSPEEKVAELRSRYRARLNGFIVRQTPVAPAEQPAEFVEGAPAEGAEGPPAEAEPAEAAPVETTRTVLLDILVQHDANEKLPGVTLDVTLAADGGQGAQKGHWLVWVDTAGLAKATQKQISHELTDAAYQEGDGFHVEVRHPVPAAERGDYKEFREAGSGG